MKLYDAGEIDKLAEQYEVADMLCLGDAQESADEADAEDTETADGAEAEAEDTEAADTEE